MTSARAARTAASSTGTGATGRDAPPIAADVPATPIWVAGLAHQVAPGSARRTEVNSPHSQRKSAPWSSRPRSGSARRRRHRQAEAAKIGAIEARQRRSSSAIGAARIPASTRCRLAGERREDRRGVGRQRRPARRAAGRAARRRCGPAGRATRRRASGGSAPRGRAWRPARPAAPTSRRPAPRAGRRRRVSYRKRRAIVIAQSPRPWSSSRQWR